MLTRIDPLHLIDNVRPLAKQLHSEVLDEPNNLCICLSYAGIDSRPAKSSKSPSNGLSARDRRGARSSILLMHRTYEFRAVATVCPARDEAGIADEGLRLDRHNRRQSPTD